MSRLRYLPILAVLSLAGCKGSTHFARQIALDEIKPASGTYVIVGVGLSTAPTEARAPNVLDDPKVQAELEQHGVIFTKPVAPPVPPDPRSGPPAFTMEFRREGSSECSRVDSIRVPFPTSKAVRYLAFEARPGVYEATSPVWPMSGWRVKVPAFVVRENEVSYAGTYLVDSNSLVRSLNRGAGLASKTGFAIHTAAITYREPLPNSICAP